jgi:hypothetical protein
MRARVRINSDNVCKARWLGDQLLGIGLLMFYLENKKHP